MKAICLGSAACMAEDLAAAAALGVVPGEDCALIACNRAALEFPGRVDAWATIHADLFPRWIAEREKAGREPAASYWTGDHRAKPVGVKLQTVPNWSGSSGLLTVTVALFLRCRPIVLCGIPIDWDQGHFDTPKKLWRDGSHYTGPWEKHAKEMACVRSMSGFTMRLLGSPTREWLDGT